MVVEEGVLLLQVHQRLLHIWYIAGEASVLLSLLPVLVLWRG